MANFVIFMVFCAALFFAVSIAISTYLATEKGLSLKAGIGWGLLPIVGQIVLAFKSEKDVKLVQAMYDRHLITLDEYTKTMEIAIKQK